MTLTQELYDSLVGQIRTGKIEPGGEMPTEGDLIRQTGASRTTVRVVYQRLIENGWVTRTGQGRRHRVAGPPQQPADAPDQGGAWTYPEYARAVFTARLNAASDALRKLADQIDQVAAGPYDPVEQTTQIVGEMAQVWVHANVEGLVKAGFMLAATGQQGGADG